MNLIPVGYFSKTHGLKGHLILRTTSQFDSEKIKAFFIDMNGSQAPFFIEELNHFNDGFIVRLESVDTIEKAAKLKNMEVCVEDKFFHAEIDFEYLDYTLIDKLKGEVGVIKELIDTPGNPLLRIENKGKEILLPFNTDFILKTVETKKQLFYNAPEGLIDLYL